MTKQDATREVMKIRSFFGTLTEVESQIWGVKRGLGTSDNDSQRSKRHKSSDTGVISDEPQSVGKADRVPRAKIQITDNSSLGAMMQNDSAMSAAHSGTQDAEIVDPPPVSPQVTSGPSRDIEKERDADASWTTLVPDVHSDHSDHEERVLDSETESANRESLERDKPDKWVTRRERIAQSKRMRKERKTLVLLSGGKNDISVRDPLPVTPIAVVNKLTGTEELFMRSTETPDNYAAESKTRLDDISNAVNKTEAEQLRTSFAQAVSHAVGLYVLQRGEFSDSIPETFGEAKQSRDRQKWQVACDEEMKAHRVNGTFTLVNNSTSSEYASSNHVEAQCAQH